MAHSRAVSVPYLLESVHGSFRAVSVLYLLESVHGSF